MANTFSDLETRVQTRLIDVRAEVTAEIPLLINEAIQALCGVHNWNCMKAELQFITNSRAANPHILGQIPTGTTSQWQWKEPRGDPYYLMQIGDTREMVYTSSRTMTYRQFSAFDTFDVGPPRQLLIGEASNPQIPDPANADASMGSLNIEVYPMPDGMSDWNTAPGGEYRVNIPYWGYLPDLSSPTSVNWFTLNAAPFIIDFATGRGFQLDWDETRAQYWLASAWGQKFDGSNQSTIGGWARVAFNRDKSIAYAPVTTLKARRDVFGSPWQWRQ